MNFSTRGPGHTISLICSVIVGSITAGALARYTALWAGILAIFVMAVAISIDWGTRVKNGNYRIRRRRRGGYPVHSVRFHHDRL